MALCAPSAPNLDIFCHLPNQICMAHDDDTWDLRGSSISERAISEFLLKVPALLPTKHSTQLRSGAAIRLGTRL